MTALIYTAVYGRSDCMRVLLEVGAGQNAKDSVCDLHEVSEYVSIGTPGNVSNITLFVGSGHFAAQIPNTVRTHGADLRRSIRSY